MWKTAACVELSCAVENLLSQRQLAAADAGAPEVVPEEAVVEEAVLEEAAAEVPAPAAVLGVEAATPPALASRESVR
jgi:hypothetical protein